jgi:quercetin dioxygenase-like cupin family protein
MKVKRTEEVEAKPVAGLPGVRVRKLWADSDGAPTFALRLFEVEPGSSTPYHAHGHEHEVYVLTGEATLRTATGERKLAPGDTVLVGPEDLHAFGNSGKELARFLCAVPLRGDAPLDQSCGG